MNFETLEFIYWHWWLMAVVLFIIEVMVPATFFLWMGVSALMVGALAALFPGMSTTTELMIFAVLSIATVIAWRVYQAKNPPKTDHPNLNRRGSDFMGRTLTLTKPMIDGFGKEKVGSTLWTLQGPDAAVGDKVKITGQDGAIFLVEKA